MKVFIQLCFLLSLPLSIQAQAILEHTYPTTDLHRVHWTFGGEHYWFSDDSLKVIKVYSATHQLEKTIRYPSVLNSQVRLLKSEHAVTQSTVNTDNLLEMVWFFTDTLTKKEQVKIMNERDSVLFVFNSAVDNIEFSEIEDLPTKLFITVFENGLDNYITKIYDFPNFSLENIYFRAHRLHRKKFGYAGERYFYKDIDAAKMQIYKPDHSFWKGVSLKFLDNINLTDYDDESYTDADDNIFSKDSLVEVIFSCYQSGNNAVAIVNGNGTLLHKSNYTLRLDHQKGLEDKLFEEIYRSNQENLLFIYSLPNFVVEVATFASYPQSRTLFKKYGEVMTRFHSNELTYFYNNYRNFKKINFTGNVVYPYSVFPSSFSPIVNDSVVNRDTLVEVIYTERNDNKYTTKIINEKGFIYNTIDSTRYFSINQSPNLSQKLITKTGNDKPYDTKVWRFNTTTPTKEAPSVLEAKIYPNPFSKSITIETQEDTRFPLKIRLINALGEVVLATTTNESKTDLALPNLAKGVYFLELTDENKRTVREIVKTD